MNARQQMSLWLDLLHIPTTSHSHPCTLHFLSGEGLSHFTIVGVDCMVFLNCWVDDSCQWVDNQIHSSSQLHVNTALLTDNPVDWVVVIKSDKSEAPLLSSITISHDVNDLNFAKLLEVISQMRLFRVLLNPTDEDLFDRDMGSGAVRVLRPTTII